MSGGAAAEQRPRSFSVVAEVPLKHLPNNGKIAVQRQRGGYVPDDAVQFYLGWSWDAPTGGRAWKGGGSIQAEQIPDVIKALSTALDKAGGGKAEAAPGEAKASDGQQASAAPPTYIALADVPLKHLPNGARFIVQRQRGGMIPDGVVQFYLAWSTVKANGGTLYTGGGSIQADQVPDFIDALARAYEKETGERLPSGTGASTQAYGGFVLPDGSSPSEPAAEEARTGRTGTFADMCADDEEEAG